MNGAPEAMSPSADRLRTHTVTSCPICAARRFRYLFSVDHHRLVRCHECQFTLLNPQPSEAELASIHEKSAAGAVATAEGGGRVQEQQRMRAELRLEEFIAFSGLTSGRLLLLGNNAQELLIAASRRGFVVTLIELSKALCEFVQRRISDVGVAVDIVRADIDAIADRSGQFDGCLLVDVIDSARNPRQLLQQLHRLLRPEAVCMVVARSHDPRFGKVTGFRPDRLSYFTRKTLESLLFAQGFRDLTWMNHRRSADGHMLIMGRRREQVPRPRLSIIVPVFNEAPTFGTAFSRLLAHPFPNVDVEYVVVESNSTDGSRALVNDYAGHPNVRIILEDRPRGKGHAVRAGLRVCTGDFVAIQDADLEYDLDDYDALLEPLITNREAFVLGARHGGRSWKMRQFAGQPVTSSVFNLAHWVFTCLLNVTLGIWMRDPFTMYKLFRRDCIHNLHLEANRFDFDWELVIKLIRKGYHPVEIPVNYRSRTFGEGKKVSVIRDPITWLIALARFRFQPLRPNTTAPAARDKLSV